MKDSPFPTGYDARDLVDDPSRNIALTGSQFYIFNLMNVSRKIRYHLYDLIEEWHPEITAALNIIADEACITGMNNEIFDIVIEKMDGGELSDLDEAEVAAMTTILNQFFFKTLNISEMAWSWVRNLAKYGDWFVEPVFGEKGIIDVEPIYDLQNVSKIDDKTGLPYYFYMPDATNQDIPNYIAKDFSSSMIWQPAVMQHFTPTRPSDYLVLFDGELIHFKLEDKPQFFPYGTSHLEAIRQTWELLRRMEDAIWVYRIVRAPERKIYYIYTGKLPTFQALEYVNLIRNSLKRSPNSNTIDFTMSQFKDIESIDKRFRHVSVDEDLWIPVSAGGESTKVDTLPGANNFSDVGDVEYFRQKLYTGLRIPKAYLSLEENTNRATLQQQDVHFARIIHRFQAAISKGLEQLAIMQLTAWFTGMKSGSYDDFEKAKALIKKYKISFRWTTASFIEEAARYEGYKARMEIAEGFTNLFGPSARAYIIEKIFRLSPDEKELLMTGEMPEEGAAGGGPTATGTAPFGEMPSTGKEPELGGAGETEPAATGPELGGAGGEAASEEAAPTTGGPGETAMPEEESAPKESMSPFFGSKRKLIKETWKHLAERSSKLKDKFISGSPVRIGALGMKESYRELWFDSFVTAKLGAIKNRPAAQAKLITESYQSIVKHLADLDLIKEAETNDSKSTNSEVPSVPPTLLKEIKAEEAKTANVTEEKKSELLKD
jgi:hypothetical protein